MLLPLRMPEDAFKTQGPVQPKKHGSSLIVLLLVAALAGGGVTWAMLRQRAPIASEGPQVRKVREVLHLEEFVVNLADHDSRAFLKIGIDLGQLKPQTKNREGNSFVPAIRDSVLTVIAKCKSDELLTPEGKNKLKQDLLAALQQRVPEAYVTEIYFTDFLVQH